MSGVFVYVVLAGLIAAVVVDRTSVYVCRGGRPEGSRLAYR